MYSSSRTWQSAQYRDVEDFRRSMKQWLPIEQKLVQMYGLVSRDYHGNPIKDHKRKIVRTAPILALVPRNVREYMQYRKDIKVAEHIAREMLPTPKCTVDIPAFRGRVFEKNTLSPVLCKQTIWCPGYDEAIKLRKGANVWPTRDVLTWEGDDRQYARLGSYKRFLPLVRDFHKQRRKVRYDRYVMDSRNDNPPGVLHCSEFDTVWKTPEFEDAPMPGEHIDAILGAKWPAPIEQFSREEEEAILCNELRRAIDCFYG